MDEVENIWLGVQKHRKIEKVTGSRDAKGEVGISMRILWIWWRLWAGRCGAHEWRTADPSASPDFLWRVVTSVSCMWFSLERTTSVVAGEGSEAGNPGTLEMTKRRG